MKNEIQKFKEDNSGLNLFNPETFQTAQRVAKMFASSALVPDMYKAGGKVSMEEAMGNCIIALDVAQRIGANPLMVMQNMVPIYGKPTWSSTFLIATVNTCGRFEPLKYKFENLGKIGKVKYTEYVWDQQTKRNKPVTKEFDGTQIDNWQCIAYTTPKGRDEVLEGTPIDVVMAIKEGWYTKNGSKWPSMTKQMLQYRAAAFWVRSYAPELSMGMHTSEEIKDTIDITYEEVNEEIKAKEDIKERGNSKHIDPNDIPEAEKPKDDKGHEDPNPPQGKNIESSPGQSKKSGGGGASSNDLKMQNPSF